jgi:tetratricopeptide (TPR) repeat protein
LGLADLLSTLGREAEAREWIARAAAAGGGSPAPHVARASLEFRAGRNEAALEAAGLALALDPRDLGAGVIRTRALARLGRHSESARAGADLLASHPDSPAAQGALGVSRLAAGDHAGALPLLRAASARLLDDAGLAWDLGRAALASGELPLALEAFERATRAEPGLVQAWLAVADVRDRLGDKAGAVAALERAETLPGADAEKAAVRARVHAR